MASDEVILAETEIGMIITTAIANNIPCASEAEVILAASAVLVALGNSGYGMYWEQKSNIDKKEE